MDQEKLAEMIKSLIETDKGLQAQDVKEVEVTAVS